MSLQPTPNLGLLKFAGTDDFDFAQVNQNADAIDSLAICTSCTAATRPTSNRYIGRLIWQTDTSEFYLWNGAAWVLVPLNAITQPTVCTSTTRPTTNLFTGRLIYETDTTKFYRYRADLPGWVEQAQGPHTSLPVIQTFTPTIGGTASPTVHSAKYILLDKFCYWHVLFTLTAAYTAGGTISLPVTSIVTPAGYSFHFAEVHGKDVSAGLYFQGKVIEDGNGTTGNTSGRILLPAASTNSNLSQINATTPVTWASGDTFSIEGMYPIP